MAYVKVTPETWAMQLTSGKYKSEGSAKKAIGRMDWPDAVKDKCRTLVDQHYTTGGPIALPVTQDRRKTKTHKSSRSGAKPDENIRSIIGRTVEILQGYEICKRINPDFDASTSEMLAERVLAPIAQLLVERTDRLTNSNGADKEVEFFDKSAPKPAYLPDDARH